ncbi:MAG: transcription antitermination factor NusB [Hyphomicrobiales bacterium]|nr:transcription antitermination factor NusB [Hyphomicrobiales bacterium]MCP5373503.1 transcription antitermination factor NusB [Hyphomicrobiales bacterium]
MSKGATARSRSVARLCAVQALYELDITGAPVDPVLTMFMQDRWDLAGGVAGDGDLDDDDDAAFARPRPVLPPAKMKRPETGLLADLVRGVEARRGELDEMLMGGLEQDRPVARLEVLVRAILRAGAYELLTQAKTPAKVVITEYVDVARSFFTGPEPGLVNAVLDKLARVLRAEEFEDTRPRGA